MKNRGVESKNASCAPPVFWCTGDLSSIESLAFSVYRDYNFSVNIVLLCTWLTNGECFFHNGTFFIFLQKNFPVEVHFYIHVSYEVFFISLCFRWILCGGGWSVVGWGDRSGLVFIKKIIMWTCASYHVQVCIRAALTAFEQTDAIPDAKVCVSTNNAE